MRRPGSVPGARVNSLEVLALLRTLYGITLDLTSLDPLCCAHASSPAQRPCQTGAAVTVDAGTPSESEECELIGALRPICRGERLFS